MLDTKSIIDSVTATALELLYEARKRTPRRAAMLEAQAKYEDGQLCPRCRKPNSKPH